MASCPSTPMLYSNTASHNSISFNSFIRLRFTSTLLFILFALPLTTAEVQNITVHNSDPSITYSPSQSSWSTIPDSNARSGNIRVAQGVLNGQATFSRTFRSIYIMAPLWPFPININVSIGSNDKIIDLQDHSVATNTVSTPFWSANSTKPSGVRGVLHNTGNISSTVTIQPANSTSGKPGDAIALLDAIIFEIVKPEGDSPSSIPGNKTPTSTFPSPTMLSSPPKSTSTGTNGENTILGQSPTNTTGGPGSVAAPFMSASPGDGQHKGKSPRLTVVICVVLGLSVLLVLGGMIWWALRKRYERRNRTSSVDNMFDKPADTDDEKDTGVFRDDFATQNDKPPPDTPECLDTPSHSEGEITSASSSESHHPSEDSSDWCRRFGAAYDELSRKRSLKHNNLDGTTRQLILETTPFNRFSHPSGFDRR